MLTAAKMALGAFPMTVKQLSKLTGDSTTTIRHRIPGIREQIRKGRYNEYVLIEAKKGTRINFYAYYDYEKYREALENRNTCKAVPPFDPERIAQVCPVVQEVIFVDSEGGDEA
jgi:hypothetical protein